jgi:outer membrane protein
MSVMMKRVGLASAAAAVLVAAGAPAFAGDSNGNFQAKLGITGVLTDDHTKSLTLNGAELINTFPGGAGVSDTVIPSLTLTYYLNKNIALELFCCFDKVHVNALDSGLNGAAKQASLAETWIFPLIVTAQYHFDKFGPLRPYVGAGFEWIHYFDSNAGGNGISNITGGTVVKTHFSDSFGPAIQGGIDYDLGGGWSLGVDVKKVWEDSKITWVTSNGNTVVAKHDLDPLFVTANVGYRFNLDDLFGRRAAPAPLK